MATHNLYACSQTKEVSDNYEFNICLLPLAGAEENLIKEIDPNEGPYQVKNNMVFNFNDTESCNFN